MHDTQGIHKSLHDRSATHGDATLWPPYHDNSVTVDVTIPCHNEAATLSQNITLLAAELDKQLPNRYLITIADSGSTDTTLVVAKKLKHDLPHIRIIHEDRKGRGRVLKHAWLTSQADIVMYMDEDLSTGLDAIAGLIRPLIRGAAVIVTGSRRLTTSQVKRSLKREIISRTYIGLLKRTLDLKVSDAQCGFKAMRRDAALELLPEIRDDAWFFDTELLVKAARRHWNTHEVAIRWSEDPDSRVNIVRAAVDDIRGIDRLRQEFNRWLTFERLMLGCLLGFTALLYLIGLTKSGYANSFYAAAVQAATHSWKAFFFGSLDASNFITVDKPPVAIWVMGLSGRLLGFSSFSMLLPEALAGIATVYLVYKIVRRWFEANSALLAGIVMALSPVAALMFRFNNPDAILTLLLTASVYAFIRGFDGKRTIAWLSLAGILTGFAFNTKMIQGLIVLPVLAATYLYAASPRFIVRLKQLLLVGIPTAISLLWWPIIVSLIPAANRPYIGSSTNNNIWNLIFGYNGVGRLLGTSGGMGGGTSAPTGTSGSSQMFGQAMQGMSSGIGMMNGKGGGQGPGGSGFGGSTGILRMFNSDFGPNIGWLLPFALVTLIAALWMLRRAPRTDRRRVAFLVWGGWLILHIIVFSMVSGVIHPYYVLVMAPAVAALIGMGLPWLFRAYQQRRTIGLLLPISVGITALVANFIFGYQTDWLPWLRWTSTGIGLLSAIGLLLNYLQPLKRVFIVAATGAILAVSAGPISYTFVTASLAHTGSVPTAGPSSTGLQGSSNESSTIETSLKKYLLKHMGNATWIAAVASANESAPIQLSTGKAVMAVGGFSGSDNAISLSQFKKLVTSGKLQYYIVSSGNGSSGGPNQSNSSILSWVKTTGTIINYGGSQYTLYQL